MSIYVDSDNDGLFKKKVERTCACCLSRFEKYKIDIKVLKEFDELANHYEQHSRGAAGGGLEAEGNECGLCEEFISLLNGKGSPFKCRICSKVFSNPLHLQEHRLDHVKEGQERGTDHFM